MRLQVGEKRGKPPQKRWVEDVEERLYRSGLSQWRRQAQNRVERRLLVLEARSVATRIIIIIIIIMYL